MFVRLTLCPRLDSTCRSQPPVLSPIRAHSLSSGITGAAVIPLRRLADFLLSWRALDGALIDYSMVRTKALSGSLHFRQNVILFLKSYLVDTDTCYTRVFAFYINEETCTRACTCLVDVLTSRRPDIIDV